MAHLRRVVVDLQVKFKETAAQRKASESVGMKKMLACADKLEPIVRAACELAAKHVHE